MDLICINDLVDGLTKGKIYKVISRYCREDGVYYGIYDDYGAYNSYKSDRFMIITDTLTKNLKKYLNY